MGNEYANQPVYDKKKDVSTQMQWVSTGINLVPAVTARRIYTTLEFIRFDSTVFNS
jgi:hypothetical protein